MERKIHFLKSCTIIFIHSFLSLSPFLSLNFTFMKNVCNTKYKTEIQEDVPFKEFLALCSARKKKYIYIYLSWAQTQYLKNIYYWKESYIYEKSHFSKRTKHANRWRGIPFQNTETTGQSQSASWQLPSFSSEHSRWYCPALPWRTVGLSEEKEMGLWLARGRAGLKPSLLTSETLFNNNTNLSSLEVKLTH